jgi:hypothetical protein
MADDKKEGIDASQSTPDDKAAAVDVEAQIEKAKEEARAEALREAEGKYKKEISTRDQAITKLQKDVNATKSDEEKAKIEAEEQRKAILSKYSKLAVKAAGLADDFSDLITGTNEDEIDSKIETFIKVKESIEKPHFDVIKTHLEKIKSLEEEITILKASGAAPKGGGATEPATLQSAYDDAKKRGDFAAQTAIKRQASKTGVELREY